ncbi:threonine aldolase family protein [Shewanella colwelliana]|uniref:threonine aldolase family protein n=1 Tax=Shewanella colwelliana TaxID=23 RepID=UPI0022B01292|nr:beta-eliminating lyase-related protein [Shewanella colwelliana]MCZ4339276.1 beta-eliminating lyase-related protein [Shewanella colwelliana]
MQNKCKYVLPGNHRPQPAELFESMAQWCRKNDVKHDIYGEGDLIQSAEQKIADLLGFEAGLFVITGTLAQPTALQLACISRNCFNVAMHQSSHIYLRERQGFQMQNRFNVLPVGDPYVPWLLEDLEAIPDKIGAVLYELPMREIGGQLPSFDALNDIKQHCEKLGVHLHMDGARLWEAAAFYNKTYKEIAQGFNSVYVSMYKGINGLSGAFLLGDKEFIKKAGVWMKRQGGNVYHRSPYVVAAMMQFDERLAKMPTFFERTKQLTSFLAEFENITPNPTHPQSNIIHLYFPKGKTDAVHIRDVLAKEHSIWIGNPQQAALPNQSFVEWYIGDYLQEIDDKSLKEILSKINFLMGSYAT